MSLARMPTMLKDINVSKSDYMIKVRIIRMWTKPTYKDSTKVYIYEMIIMDEQGTKMEASVLGRYTSLYQNLLNENQCVFIHRPTLAQNNVKWQVYQNQHKLCFTERTVLQRCDDVVGLDYGFDFTSFKILEEKSIAEGSIVDVIGAVIKHTPITERVLDSGSKSITLDLQDLDNHTLSVTIWEVYAVQFDEYVKNHHDARELVIILQFGRFKIYRGESQVGNVYNVSKLFINEDIEVLNSFKKKFIANHSSPSGKSISGFTSSLNNTLKDDFFKNSQLCTIVEINEIREPKSLIIVGVIKGFCDDGEWYYKGCKKCNTKVTTQVQSILKPDDSGDYDEVSVLVCKGFNCTPGQVVAVPRFRIPIRVQDFTGTVSLTLFHRDATRILGTTVNEILEKNEEFDKDGKMDGNIPSDFNSLLDRKFAFKIQVTKYNIENNKENYSISRLMSDADIIEETEKKIQSNQPIVSEDCNLGLSDIAWPTNSTMKDSFSTTGEEATPMSNVDRNLLISPLDNEKTPTSSNNGSSDLKRNLQFVYDVDEGSSQSSSKPKTDSSKKIEDADCEQILLIPKIEK